MRNGPVVIWVNSPPFVERGAFEYLEECWPDGVVYAVLGDFRSERRSMGWDQTNSRLPAVLLSKGDRTLEQFCEDCLAEFPSALHLIGGLSSTTGRALSLIARTVPPNRIAVFTERPGAYGPFFKRLLSSFLGPIKYRILVKRYRTLVGLLLPLGLAGVAKFVRYGWPVKNTAPFMYCPSEYPRAKPQLRNRKSPVRFLYIGRLSRFTKGTDVLLSAADKLHGDWHLTFIGGHGDLVEDVKSWAKPKSNITLLGALTPLEIAAEINQYDICIVPSRFDGWNVVVNEALRAGKPVIATNEAVSHELVSRSKAGLVVKAKSPRALAKAMQQVIDNPSLVHTWSTNAELFAPLISPRSVGEYLFHQLESLTNGTPFTSIPPWLHDQGAQEGEEERA